VNEFLELVGRQLASDLRSFPRQARRSLSGQTKLGQCRNIADLRELGRRKTPRAIFDFVDGAAGDEVTAQNNTKDFAEIALQPKILAGAGEIDLSTTALGEPIAVPLLGAPTGLTGLVHYRGEVAIARAVHDAGSIYVHSAMASYSIEELAAEAPGPKWFQLYVWRDRGLVRELIDRAAAAGHQALVLTGDTAYLGSRERDLRNGFGIPPRLTFRSLTEGLVRPRWSLAFLQHPRMKVANVVGSGAEPSDARSLTEYIGSQFDPTLNWNDLAWVREVWSGPVVVKGVLRPDDAVQAARLGADAVIVSNHGGRQLDHSMSSIRALPAIVAAVGEDVEVYLDSGIRRGSDILKALALGARACLSGRGLVYGLAAGGDAGAGRAMQVLTNELRLALALLGCPSIRKLDGTWIAADE
jgi:isopentenyl diphosphate isomerase/L-lactate dehydrogenase-like FMN-dependent dehydrogenase